MDSPVYVINELQARDLIDDILTGLSKNEFMLVLHEDSGTIFDIEDPASAFKMHGRSGVVESDFGHS